MQGELHQIGLSIEFLPDLFADGYFGPIAGGREKGGDAHPGHLDAGSQGPLGKQVHFQLPAEELAFELGVLTYVGADHLFYLPGFEEQAKSKIIHSGIMEIQVSWRTPLRVRASNTVLGETAQHDHGGIRDVPDSLIGIGN